MNQLEARGSQEIRPPVALERPARLTLMRVEAVLNARSISLCPTSAEGQLFAWKGVLGGFEEL
jgi:hypothetical protein